MTPTPQSVQDEKITDLLTAANTDRHETNADLRKDIHALQIRVSSVEDAVEVNTRLTEGINSDTKEILGVFASWKGAMSALDMIGKLARPLSYIAALGAAIAGMYAAFKTGQGPR